MVVCAANMRFPQPAMVRCMPRDGARHVPELTAELERRLVWRLAQEWAELNWSLFGNVLRPVALGLLEGRSRLGQWCAADRSIGLSREAILARPWLDTIETLKHEMAHQYVDEVLGGEPTPHGPRFRQVCQMRGIDPAATGGDPSTVGPSKEDRIIDRVRKLLALAESSNQHEAELAASTAQRLILKFNIDIDARTPDQDRPYAYAHLGKPTGRVQAHQQHLASLLLEHFFVRAIWVSTYDPLADKKGTVLEICGRPENLQMAEFVHDFVLRTAERLWRAHKKAHRITSDRERRAFIAGAVSGFSAKLREKRAEAQREGLVWVGDAGVAAYMRRRHPRTRTCRGSEQSHADAYARGQSAGRTIVLSRPVSSGGGSGGARRALPSGRG
jgi:hypothetical protein